MRSPAAVVIFSFITLGIYGLFWYHHTNRELRDYDSSIVVKPFLAVLALFIPTRPPPNLNALMTQANTIFEAEAEHDGED